MQTAAQLAIEGNDLSTEALNAQVTLSSPGHYRNRTNQNHGKPCKKGSAIKRQK